MFGFRISPQVLMFTVNVHVVFAYFSPQTHSMIHMYLTQYTCLQSVVKLPRDLGVNNDYMYRHIVVFA